MARRAHLEDADRRMRSILEEAGLPEPDEVNYFEDEGELELLWHEPKLAVIVECGPDCRAEGEGRPERELDIPF